MKLYGIFDKLDGYRLDRYSTALVGDYQGEVPVPGVRGAMKKVHYVCLPNVEFSMDYIGKQYNPETKTFSDN